MTVERLILAGIPEELAAKVQSGAYERVGMLVRDAVTKKIRGHLQETGLTQSIVTHVMESGGHALNVSSFLSPATAIGQGVSIYQNEQIKRQIGVLQTMMGGMQAMQIATLATSVAGIGVTVASTVLILNRLKSVEAKMDALGDRIDAAQQRSEDAAIKSTLARIETYLERLAEADQVRDKEGHLRNGEEQLHNAFTELSKQTASAGDRKTIDAEFFLGLLSALALSSSAQVRSLIQLGELERAESRAMSQTTRLNEIAKRFPRDTLAKKLQGDEDGAKNIDLVFTELRLRSASMPTFVQSLSAHGVDPREYFQIASSENEKALLLLGRAHAKS